MTTLDRPTSRTTTPFDRPAATGAVVERDDILTPPSRLTRVTRRRIVLRLVTHLGLTPEPRPGAAFLATAVLVAVPSIALAWLSSRTVEAAGLRLATLVDRDGRKREYYPHLAAEPA